MCDDSKIAKESVSAFTVSKHSNKLWWRVCLGVGLARTIYTHRVFWISLPKALYMHGIHMVLASPIWEKAEA